jgi:putative transposase
MLEYIIVPPACIFKIGEPTMLRAYKYRIYPNKLQTEQIEKQFGACRFVYNWVLEQKIKVYQTEKKTLSSFAITNHLTILKKSEGYEWLQDGIAQSLQMSIRNLDNAFTKFFREKKGFPKFKSKKNPVQSFQMPQHYAVDFEEGNVKLPKMGKVKASLSRVFDGICKTATVSRSTTGKYYISILVEDNKDLPEKQKFSDKTTIGVDVGIKDFAVLSNGEKVNNPKYLKNSLLKLKTLSRKLSRKIKGSNNWKKAKLQLAKLYEKITNQRNDFQHKLSLKLVCENQAIALETLKVCNMVKNHCLAQAILDAGWSSFATKLEYKAEWYGKTILRIGQFEPSSKLCSVCGYHNKELTLAIREWNCPECKTFHDRDINAAINIKKFALQDQNLIGI